MKPQTPIPPRRAEQFLLWFLRDDLAEEVLGDLEEKFFALAEEKSVFRATLNYWYQVLNYLRPFAIRHIPFIPSHMNMFQHYSLIAWRNLKKNQLYSAIKIGGFALGIAACLLIALFIKDELRYDSHYKASDRLYRLLVVNNKPGDLEKWPALPAPIGEVLQTNFPQIEKSGRLIPYDWFDAGDNQFRPIEHTQNIYEEGFVYADPELLDILEIPLIYGSKEQALAEPNTMVISRRKAEKYFPNEDPVGKLIILNEDESAPYKIGGVMEDMVDNSFLQYDFLLTLTEKEFWEGEQGSWCCWNYDSYMRLVPGADPTNLEEKLLAVRDDYIVKHSREQGDVRADEEQQYLGFELQPVQDIYLRSQNISDNLKHGDIRVVWIFGIISAFILLLACINFINLSTAKSANRAREVGLRKVVGSFRHNLIQQFLTESMVFSGISFVLGTALAWLLLPSFNKLADKALVFPWTETWLFPVLLGSILLTGILAGLYPAVYLSSFKPIDVLKGSLSRGSKGAFMQGSLVVFQFTTSIVLIICTLVTYQQMQFILNKKIGFDKEQVLLVQGANTLGDKYASFKAELERFPEVKAVTISNYLPVSGTKRDFNTFWKDGRSKEDEGVSAQIWRVGEDYLETLGMKLIEGRTMALDRASDSSSLIINQTMARELGLKNPIGAKVMNWRTWTIVGVVEDFHFESLKGEIVGLCFALGEHGSIVPVKVQTGDMAGTIAEVSEVWAEFLPNQPIRYTFLDQQYAKMYEDVRRTGNVFTVFASLAIIVACLGLFALSAFMVEQRRKEITIRKVLGASVGRLLGLLTANFLWLVVISLALAVPIGWYAMHRWLEDYSSRIEISWEVFVIAGALTLGIALLTISYESIRVVRRNPAESLRAE